MNPEVNELINAAIDAGVVTKTHVDHLGVQHFGINKERLTELEQQGGFEMVCELGRYLLNADPTGDGDPRGNGKL